MGYFPELNRHPSSFQPSSTGLKMISQKLKLTMNFFETFPGCSPPSTFSKKTIKVIGHHSRLRDMMGQSYPIYPCTRANHAHCS